LIHRIIVLSYCIPRDIKLQKVYVPPILSKKTPAKGGSTYHNKILQDDVQDHSEPDCHLKI